MKLQNQESLLVQGQAWMPVQGCFCDSAENSNIFACVCVFSCAFMCLPLRPQVQELMLESYSAAYNTITHVLGLKPVCKTTLCDSTLLILLVESH